MMERMGGATIHPFSDFAVHHMGSNLADGVIQGGAGPDEFRTAPLWGVGQRLFFLHDGRASNLVQAITQHSSTNNECVTTTSDLRFFVDTTNTGNPNVVSFFEPTVNTQTCGSEANTVISNYSALSTSQKQDLLNFLRSL